MNGRAYRVSCQTDKGIIKNYVGLVSEKNANPEAAMQALVAKENLRIIGCTPIHGGVLVDPLLLGDKKPKTAKRSKKAKKTPKE